MSLTYAKLQDLRGQGFDTLYKRNKSRWLALAKAAYESYAALLPESEQPRIDDAAKFLYVSLEIDDVLRKMMQENSISAKKWIQGFGDLILDDVWGQLIKTHKPKEEKK